MIPLTFICFSILFVSFCSVRCVENLFFISTNRLHIKSHFSNLKLGSILSPKAHFSHVATEVYKIFNAIFTFTLMQVQFNFASVKKRFFQVAASEWEQRNFPRVMFQFSRNSHFPPQRLHAHNSWVRVIFIIFYVTVKCHVFNLFDCGFGWEK